ncbi:clathrin coat assembly protein, putative [Trypanosoma cruzi]|uniref:Clathrin coat assembly protein n=2 Tax=Trypanosoma cruzi TaxID=5693 RepID=V5BKQ8_TRYCR|nr:clathrin coat assembly protein, putative [Trypanosoma cruzi]ESS68374.1 clathrin coat assembly protein [Trypanosoma cruzi Dm28c]PBJ68988.1 mu-adaptin 3,adaptor complex AP-3 medium subunit [Trypanosoma cruzi cruzi]KAF8307913.1 putative AP-3 complex subunit mu [Trypanosoma cruzi]PWV00237.1 putative AP-3 complex subunit mu [Trypanosoma cruzi]
MISSVFFLNHHGEVIIEKQFREKLPRTILEDFWSTYMTPLRSVHEAPAVTPYSRFAFVQIHRNDVVLLAILTNEGFPLLVIEILSLIGWVVQEYLKVFSENTLRENFSVVYQLLEELIDNGYPLTTEMHVLEELVVPPTLENKFRNVLDAPMKKRRRHSGVRSVPWRDPLTRHTSNEIFFDVVEKFDCIVDCEGNIVRAVVRGAVHVNCRLTGMPDVVVRMANLDFVDDFAFHRCVRRHRYETDRTITFIPPDGKFTLLEYLCKPLLGAQAPFYVTPQITFDKSGGRFNCMVGLRGAGSIGKNRDYGIHKVVIHLPLPPQTESVQVHSSTQGTTNFNKTQGILTWSVGTLFRGTSSLSGEFTFSTDKGADGVIPCTGDSAIVEFNIPNHLLSSIRMDSVQVLNEIGKPYKGVKYVTHSGRFVVRTV